MKKSKFLGLILSTVLFAGATVGLSSAAQAEVPFPTGAGYQYKIMNVNSNKAMDVAFNSKDPTIRLNQWEYLGLPSQHWKLYPTGDGLSYWIENQNSGMYVEAENYGDGGRIVQKVPNRTLPQQKWVISPVGSAYTIRNYQTGTVIDVEFNKQDNGWYLHTWHYIDGVQSQLWRFEQI